MRYRIVAAVLIAAGLSLYLPVTGFAKAAAGMLLAFLLPGFVLLHLLGAHRGRTLDDIMMSVLLSPAALVLLLLLGGPLAGSLRGALLAAFGVLFALLAARLLRRPPLAADGDSPAAGTALLVSIGFAGLVAGLYLLNPFLVIRSDAFYHASVVTEILERGYPPMEPRLPDIPIRYMWTYHLFAASLVRLTGLSVFEALAAFNVIVSLAFPYCVYRFTTAFTTRRGHIVAAMLLGISGMQSASWILFPAALVRGIVGAVSGREEILRIIGAWDLNSAAVIHFLAPYRTWMVNLIDKFVTITAFSYSLCLFMTGFTVMRQVLDGERTFRRAALLFLVVLGAFLFHVVTGGALIAAIAGSSVLLAVLYRIRGGRHPAPGRLALAAAAAVAALAAGFPYLRSLVGSGGSGPGVSPGFGATSALTILASVAVLMPFSARAIADTFSARDGRRTLLAAWLAVLALMAVAVDMPTVNESKLLFPLFLLLTPPVSLVVADRIAAVAGRRRIVLVVWIFLLFAVPAALTVRGFLIERPRSAVEDRRYRLTDDDRALFAWIRSSTAEDAVFMENNDYNLIPVHAGRRSFFPTEQAIRVNGYGGETVDLYREARRNVFSGEEIPPALLERLGRRGIDLYILVWEEDRSAGPEVVRSLESRADLLEPVYRNGSVTVFHLRDAGS